MQPIRLEGLRALYALRRGAPTVYKGLSALWKLFVNDPVADPSAEIVVVHRDLEAALHLRLPEQNLVFTRSPRVCDDDVFHLQTSRQPDSII